MPLRKSVFIATSLDGFIARPDGSLDWLTQRPTGQTEDYGYNTFIETVDVLVMGRATYETVLGFGQWPYGTTDVYVLTHRPDTVDLPSDLRQSVHVTTAQPAELVLLLESAGKHHAYIDGGKTIQAFLSAGLIDDLIISRIPVLLGRGIPLFGPTQNDIELLHVWTQSFDSGVVQSEYRVEPTW